MPKRPLAVSQPDAAAMFAALLAASVIAIEIRMEDVWGDAAKAAVAVLPALLTSGPAALLGAGPGRRPAATAILVTVAVLFVPAALGLTLTALGAHAPFEHGYGLSLSLLVTVVAVAVLGARTGSPAAWFLGAVFGVALILEGTNWVFGTEKLDVFRALLSVAGLLLIAAAVRVDGRPGTLLGAAGGLALIALGAITGGFGGGLFFFGFGMHSPWGWGAVQLVGALVLLALALHRAEPGLGYVGGITLGQVALLAIPTVSNTIEGGSYVLRGYGAAKPSITLVGWPLVLIVLTVAAAGLTLAAGAWDAAAATVEDDADVTVG